MTGRLACLALLLCLAGCNRFDPPLLTLSGRVCDAAPSFDGAVAVPFDSRGGATATYSATSPCLNAGDGRTVTYAVFRLPDAPPPYQVTIFSEVRGNAVVAPLARIYGVDGQLLRSVLPDGFRQSVTGFSAGLRTTGQERYVLVSADPATVGQPTILRLSAREVGTAVAAGAVIFVPIVVPVHEAERQRGATLSLNGEVRVSAVPIQTVP